MRFIIGDDHPLYRDAMARMLAELEPEATIAEAGSFDAVGELLETDSDCDLVVLDLYMPGGDAGEQIHRLHQRWPTVPIVIVSGAWRDADLVRVRKAGALCALSKDLDASSMKRAFRDLLNGEIPEASSNAALPKDTPSSNVASASGALLTRRQREVLHHLALGASNKQVAQALGLTEGTVKLHVTAILRALESDNRTQAVLRAQELGWVPAVGSSPEG